MQTNYTRLVKYILGYCVIRQNTNVQIEMFLNFAYGKHAYHSASYYGKNFSSNILTRIKMNMRFSNKLSNKNSVKKLVIYFQSVEKYANYYISLYGKMRVILFLY